MELIVVSTRKLNMTLAHRDGKQNIQQAKDVMSCIQYIVENATIESENRITVNDLLSKVSHK